MDPFPLYPPKAWFRPPAEMPKGSKITLISDGLEAGRSFGYVAPHNSCILTAATLGAKTDECFTAPRSPTEYVNAHQGDCVTLEGDTIQVANIGGGVNHYNDGPYQAAVDHYANTASQLLRVCYGEDDYGIWAAGAAWPDLTERQVAMVRASALSGDWRWRPHLQAYDMAGAQLVSNPGFPLLRRMAASASQEPAPIIGGWGGDFTQGGSSMEKPCTCGAHDPDPVLASLVATDREALIKEVADQVVASLQPLSDRIEEAVTRLLVVSA